MCNCNGYKKMDDEDDDCCNCCCCGCLCKCIRNTLCCCCKCGLCLFKFLCSILSCVGILLVLYLIMMICTDEYLRGAVWRDCPFEFNGYNPDDFLHRHEIEGLDETKANCDTAGYCVGAKTLYMYAHGGSGFLGAVLFDVETTGGFARFNGGDEYPITGRLYNNTNFFLDENKVNEIQVEYEFQYDTEKYPGQPTFVVDFTGMTFKSIYSGFWDFMPMGPGGSFGIAESNKYIGRGEVLEGDYVEYNCVIPNPDDN